MAEINDKKIKEDKTASSMKDLYGVDGKTGKAKGKERKSSGQAYRVLLKPLISEKSANLAHSGKYFFMVAPNANKISVAQAIFEIYHVNPVKINIMNVEGKNVTRGRIFGRKKDWKKAIVSLAKGQTIDVYEGV